MHVESLSRRSPSSRAASGDLIPQRKREAHRGQPPALPSIVSRRIPWRRNLCLVVQLYSLIWLAETVRWQSEVGEHLALVIESPGRCRLETEQGPGNNVPGP